MRRIAAICVALMLAGCATAYQPTGMTGGFEEVPLSSNAFRVTFNGNGYTLVQRSSDFVLMRAAELSLSKGCAYFLSDRGVEHISTWPPSHSIQFACYRDRPQSNGIVYDARLIYDSVRTKYRDDLGARPAPALAAAAPPAAAPAPRSPAPAAPGASAAKDCEQNKDVALRLKGCSAWIAANPGATPNVLSVAYKNRGLANAGLGNDQAALADYAKAIALNASNIDAYYYRGLMNSRLDRHNAAEKDFQKSLDLFLPISKSKPTTANQNWVKSLRQRIVKARKDGELEDRWIAYLNDIQKRNRYGNWSGPPHDLYMSRNAGR